MFRINDPTTWPQTGDRLWLPWESSIARRVSKVTQSPDGPRVLFMDGEADRLSGWQYYPQTGDRVIVSAGPLDRLYDGRDFESFQDRVLRETFGVVKADRPPRFSSPAISPDYQGEFLRLSPESGGKDVILAAVCCTVISLRHGGEVEEAQAA